jgi:phospholipid N-methyltransferase
VERHAEHTVHTKPHAARSMLNGHRPKGSGALLFLKEFFRSPIELGTFLPTAKGVGRMMVDGLGLEHASSVCECGPGTGPITVSILERLRPGARFFVIEYNGTMARSFQRRFPHVRLYQDDATNVDLIAKKHEGLPHLDAIVSAVPWMALPASVQEKMITQTAAALRPGGRFSMVTYRPEATASVKRFRRMMEDRFSEVKLKGTVWGNFPPAYVFQCVK